MISERRLSCVLAVCAMGILVVLSSCQGVSSHSSGSMQATNHIIFMAQESRSFETYSVNCRRTGLHMATHPNHLMACRPTLRA
jgi:hypothetical protein